jgi:hypothetical protein
MRSARLHGRVTPLIAQRRGQDANAWLCDARKLLCCDVFIAASGTSRAVFAETENRPSSPHIRNRPRDFVSYAGVTMWNAREDQAGRRAHDPSVTLEQSLHFRNRHDDYGGTVRRRRRDEPVRERVMGGAPVVDRLRPTDCVSSP